MNCRSKYDSVPIATKILDLLYKDKREEIECDFILINDNTGFKGKAKIIRGIEHIEIEGKIKDYVNIIDTNIDINQQSNVRIIKISLDDIPKNYQCKLVNIPNENTIEAINGRNIEINFPRVRISDNFVYNMPYRDLSNIKTYIQPLYDCNNGEIMNIIFEDVDK